MAERPRRIGEQPLATFAKEHGWTVVPAPESALEKTFVAESYGAGVAFVVRIAMAAEARDHHPDITLGYRKITVRWSTHDQGGVTQLDLDLALACDTMAPQGPSPAP
jgi:4a-hydroxytetrahydrobiopterin dehydratase